MSEPDPSMGSLDDRGGGAMETVIAVIICAIAMLGPVLYIQYRYDAFVAESGEIREGAAGATLVLAVILRTVSRTLLRTVVRASARAGLKASIKSALKTALRLGSRLLLSSIFKSFFDEEEAGRPTDPVAIQRANLKSLAIGSGLVVASWVIVLGLGQPFAELLTEAEAAEVAVQQQADLEARLAELEARVPPEVEAWQKGQVLAEKRAELFEARQALAAADGKTERATRTALVDALAIDLADANADFATALARAKGRVMPPKEIAAPEPEGDPLVVRAPYPGPTSWGAPVLWLGGLLAAMPMWFIYFAQSASAKREGVTLYHETGLDGGLIQLYFAGAFSFMPLTSDVVIEGDAAQQGRVAVAGLLAPLGAALVLYGAWKVTGLSALLLASDLFLIYPLVQCFPLSPLDGQRLWRWHRGIWFAVFVAVLGVFIFIGSEGLKSVI